MVEIKAYALTRPSSSPDDCRADCRPVSGAVDPVGLSM